MNKKKKFTYVCFHFVLLFLVNEYHRGKYHCLPITKEEYLHIKSGIPPSLDKEQNIPWCQLISSSAVWAIIISHFAGTSYDSSKCLSLG
jgi:hypothetical protein